MSVVKVRRKQFLEYDDNYNVDYEMLCDFVAGYGDEILADYGIGDVYDAPLENIVEFVNEFIYDFVFWAEKEAGQEMVARWVSEKEEIELIDIIMKHKPIVVDSLGADSVIKALNHETDKSLKDVPDVIEIEGSELKEFLKFHNKEENENE